MPNTRGLLIASSEIQYQPAGICSYAVAIYRISGVMLLLAGDVCEHRCVIMIYLVITLRGHQQNKYPITTIEAWSLVDHNPI